MASSLQNTQKLENYINKGEISQARTSEEYILWFENKLKIIKENRDLKKQIILHEGISKIFHEELFPLYNLLQNKREDWKQVKFTPIIGNQNFDVEVKTDRKDTPKYIEITVTDMNYDEHKRMEYFLGHGYVNMLGQVSTEKNRETGIKIVVDDIALSEEEADQILKDQMKKAIVNKMAVTRRPDHTALLIYFDDYTYFRYDKDSSSNKMKTFLDSIDIKWENLYKSLYVVGTSGKSFWER